MQGQCLIIESFDVVSSLDQGRSSRKIYGAGIKSLSVVEYSRRQRSCDKSYISIFISRLFSYIY